MNEAKSKQGKAFVLVGHAHWGKSETLKEFKGGGNRNLWITIENIRIFIRMTSNDDDEDALDNFIKDLEVGEKPVLVLTLCPKFSNGSKTRKILESLNKDYELFFFVLRRKYKPERDIPEEEISRLRPFGEVEVLEGKLEKKDRAKKFRDFIKKHLS